MDQFGILDIVVQIFKKFSFCIIMDVYVDYVEKSMSVIHHIRSELAMLGVAQQPKSMFGK